MRLTAKVRSAVTAMIDLTRNEGEAPVSLSSISSRQDISVAYLEQLFNRLRKGELVRSVRGPSGGYRLARSPVNITVADIVLAIDEPLDITRCQGSGICRQSAKGSVSCVTHDLWASLNEQIVKYLDSVSLHELATENQEHAPGKTGEPASRSKGSKVLLTA